MTTQIDINQELFLDILTKEEREALLTKKMEEIRKKNEALQKRHEEIQKDKRVAENFGGKKGNKTSSPQKESKPLPGEPYKFTAEPQMTENQWEDRPRPPKSGVGRGKQDRRKKENPMSQKSHSIHPQVVNGDGQMSSKMAMVEEWKKGVQSHNFVPNLYGFDNTFLQRPNSGDYENCEETSHRQSWGKENKEYNVQKNQEYQSRPNRHVSRDSDHLRRQNFRENEPGRQHKYNKQPSRESHQDGNYQRPRSRDFDSGQNRPHSGHQDAAFKEKRFNRQYSGSSGSQDSAFGRQNSGIQDGGYCRQYSGNQDGGHGHQNSGRQDGGYGRQNSGSQDSGYGYQNTRKQDNEYHKQIHQMGDSEFEPQRKRRQGAQSPTHRDQRDNSYHGPPPDPAYNFLSDRSRDHQAPPTDRKETRRHPKNFGGTDFGNVKGKMRIVKEKQERERNGPPQSKMEMTIAMTGRERRQYMEWKAERERVDQARIDRQKSTSGDWKREWDVEKDYNEEQERRSEPAKRPAGRIGSGRFDRGERDERSKGVNRPEKEHTGRHYKEMEHPQIKESDHPRPVRDIREGERESLKPAGRGRGRGRGSRRSGEDKKPPRMRTISGEDRQVENKHDLLYIKVDNSPGKVSDGTVEVEYSDGESSPQGTSYSHQDSKTSTTCAQTSTDELWWDEEADEVSLSLVGDALDDDDIFQSKDLFDGSLEEDHDGLELHDDGYDCYEEEGQFENAPPGSQSQGDTDEWEDCEDDEDDLESRSSEHSKDVNRINLNPEAPEFMPSSPVSPLSPIAKMTPTKDQSSHKSNSKNISTSTHKERSTGPQIKENKAHVKKTSTDKASKNASKVSEESKKEAMKVSKKLFTNKADSKTQIPSNDSNEDCRSNCIKVPIEGKAKTAEKTSDIKDKDPCSDAADQPESGKVSAVTDSEDDNDSCKDTDTTKVSDDQVSVDSTTVKTESQANTRLPHAEESLNSVTNDTETRDDLSDNASTEQITLKNEFTSGNDSVLGGSTSNGSKAQKISEQEANNSRDMTQSDGGKESALNTEAEKEAAEKEADAS